MEFGADHHRQLTDEHQPVFGHVAQKTDGFVGDAVVHPEEVRQLMPFDSAVSKHAQYAMQGSTTEPHLCFGTGPSRRHALPAPGVTVANTPSPQPLPVAGVASVWAPGAEPDQWTIAQLVQSASVCMTPGIRSVADLARPLRYASGNDPGSAGFPGARERGRRIRCWGTRR